jgi:hypothetical protein
MLKAGVLLIFLAFLPKFSFSQIFINTSYGRSFYSKGDFRGNDFQIGLQKRLSNIFEASLMLGSYQFSKSHEYYYRANTSGPFDQLAEFRHLVLINHADLGVNYTIINKRFKVAIGVAGSVSRLITTSPKEYSIVFPDITDFPLPIYQIYFQDKFKTTIAGPSAKVNCQYSISKNAIVGLSFSYLQLKDILVWSFPLNFKYQLDK